MVKIFTLYKYSRNQSPEYINMKDYNVAKAEFDAEARDYGTSLDDLYSYKDPEKAQWYINLWYRMNGSSTNKSTDSDAGTYYAKLDSKLLTSNSWIKRCFISRYYLLLKSFKQRHSKHCSQ